MTNKYERTKAFKDLRELHKLYDKCVPVVKLVLLGQPELGLCSCGRLLKHKGQTYWGRGATLSHEPWIPTSHRDRRILNKLPGMKTHLKGLAPKLFRELAHGTK